MLEKERALCGGRATFEKVIDHLSITTSEIFIPELHFRAYTGKTLSEASLCTYQGELENAVHDSNRTKVIGPDGSPLAEVLEGDQIHFYSYEQNGDRPLY